MTPSRRLSDDEAVELLVGGDLLSLGARADSVRRALHPSSAVTFVVDRNINYTNVCTSGCRFCAFYAKPGDPGGYVLSADEIYVKVEETLALGGTAIMLQGGLHPDLDVTWYERLFRGIKERYQVHIHSLSPPEIVHIAAVSRSSEREVIERLAAAGLDSLPGGGAEVLVDRVRREISPHKASTRRWLDVMRLAHEAGLRSTATMMFGSLETPAERVEHLRRLRDLQDETGGFTAFIPWSFQEGNTQLAGQQRAATAFDYLRMLAVSRIYLDNFVNIQASWVTQGLRVGQVALAFGANDMGSTMIEENVVAATGVHHECDVETMVRIITAAGFTAVQRSSLYDEIRRWPLGDGSQTP